jgi:4-azaleucine resistance transporter AzlC
MKKQVAKQAFITSVPIMAGYIVLGMGFGLLLHDAGFGVGWALLMSVTIYAGTMQYVGVNLLATAAPLLTVALTTFMVQARHLFYSISMIERYKDAGKYKPYLAFALTDETYSLLSSTVPPCPPKYANYYRFLVSLFNHSYWITGCVLGNLLGEVLPFSTKGLEFSMTALFVAAFTEQWIVLQDHIPSLTGFVGTLLCLLIFGPEHFLIPALLLIVLILTLLRAREEALL